MPRLYAAPRLRRWEDMAIEPEVRLNSLPHHMKAPPGNPGVLLVFDSMEALREWYPGIDEMEVLVLMVDDGGGG